MDEDDDLVKLPALAASLQLHPAPEPVHEDASDCEDPTFANSADSSVIAERTNGSQWTVAADSHGTPRKGLSKTLSHISEGDENNSWLDSPHRQGPVRSGSPGGSPAVRRPQGTTSNNAVPWRSSPSKAPVLPRKSSRS